MDQHLCPPGDEVCSVSSSSRKPRAERAREPHGFQRVGQVLQDRGLAVFSQLAVLDADPNPDPPACERCRGAGHLRIDVPLDDPKFGTLVRCPVCNPAPTRDQVLARQASDAGLPRSHRRRTFGAFKPVPGALRALNAAVAFSQKPEGWLHISGERGAGKTHLSLAIANEFVERGEPCRWIFVPDLVEEALAGMQAGRHHELLAELKAAPILILDDLGAIQNSDWAVQALLQPLCDYRYREELPTVFTSKATAAQLKVLSEGIGRRLEDPNVCVSVENQAAQWMGRE
jgi:chromosomal replication initiation ATPase DnaA